MSRRSLRRPGAVIGLALLAIPFTTLMLAKLFDSMVLGWMFGLMLMAGVALLPFAVVAYGLVRLWTGRRRRSVATIAVRIERDSVHASDDAPSGCIEIDPRASLRDLVERAIAEGHLPGISGGRATWVVESARGPIAVCAQQWAVPVFLVPADVRIAAHFGAAPARLHFRYRCQIDPADCAATLRAGLR